MALWEAKLLHTFPGPRAKKQLQVGWVGKKETGTCVGATQGELPVGGWDPREDPHGARTLSTGTITQAARSPQHSPEIPSCVALVQPWERGTFARLGAGSDLLPSVSMRPH